MGSRLLWHEAFAPESAALMAPFRFRKAFTPEESRLAGTKLKGLAAVYAGQRLSGELKFVCHSSPPSLEIALIMLVSCLSGR